MLKLLVEFGPIVVFFATYKYANIFAATLWMVLVTIISLIVSYVIDKRISIPLMISGTILIFSGFITLFSGNPMYIKMKPTIVYMVFSVILYVGYINKKSLVKEVMGSAFVMKEEDWLKLSLRFSIYFLFMALVNEVIWRNFSESFWVNFKVFGAFPITIIFMLFQVPLFMKK